jgi:hypothetical protein
LVFDPKEVGGGAFNDFIAVVEQEGFVGVGGVGFGAGEDLAEFVAVLEGGERVGGWEAQSRDDDFVGGGTVWGREEGDAEGGVSGAARGVAAGTRATGEGDAGGGVREFVEVHQSS